MEYDIINNKKSVKSNSTNNLKTYISQKYIKVSESSLPKLLVINFFLINISYFGMHYMKRGTFALEPHFYANLLLLYYGVWILLSLITGKFKLENYMDPKSALILIGRNAIFTLYILSVAIVLIILNTFCKIVVCG